MNKGILAVSVLISVLISGIFIWMAWPESAELSKDEIVEVTSQLKTELVNTPVTFKDVTAEGQVGHSVQLSLGNEEIGIISCDTPPKSSACQQKLQAARKNYIAQRVQQEEEVQQRVKKGELAPAFNNREVAGIPDRYFRPLYKHLIDKYGWWIWFIVWGSLIGLAGLAFGVSPTRKKAGTMEDEPNPVHSLGFRVLGSLFVLTGLIYLNGWFIEDGMENARDNGWNIYAAYTGPFLLSVVTLMIILIVFFRVGKFAIEGAGDVLKFWFAFVLFIWGWDIISIWFANGAMWFDVEAVGNGLIAGDKNYLWYRQGLLVVGLVTIVGYFGWGVVSAARKGEWPSFGFGKIIFLAALILGAFMAYSWVRYSDPTAVFAGNTTASSQTGMRYRQFRDNERHLNDRIVVGTVKDENLVLVHCGTERYSLEVFRILDPIMSRAKSLGVVGNGEVFQIPDLKEGESLTLGFRAWMPDRSGADDSSDTYEIAVGTPEQLLADPNGPCHGGENVPGMYECIRDELEKLVAAEQVAGN